MLLVSSCICLYPIRWSQVLSWEWRCIWSSADRRCSNYIWVINNLIAYQSASVIRDLMVVVFKPVQGPINRHHCVILSKEILTHLAASDWSPDNIIALRTCHQLPAKCEIIWLIHHVWTDWVRISQPEPIYVMKCLSYGMAECVAKGALQSFSIALTET